MERMHAIQLFARAGGPGRCPFCHDAAPPEGQGKRCPLCGVRLHDECHAILNRCPTPGCAAAVRTFHGVQVYLVNERYQVLGRTGAERYGMAIRAHDLKLDRDVTLLYLETTAPEPEGEAILAGLLDAAPTVKRGVPLLGYGRDPRGSRLFLVREFVPGGETLARVLGRRGSLNHGEAVWLGRTLLDSLGDLHGRGQAFGELVGGESLLLERREGRIHLRLINAGMHDAAQALQAASGGKAAPSGVERFYGLPPECLEGAGDPRAQDLWAAALLLYRCLTGVAPWAFRDLLELFRRYPVTPATPLRTHLPQVDPALAQAIDTALALDPAARHADARAFLAALPPG
jgi:serine/threonine protein kinase